MAEFYTYTKKRKDFGKPVAFQDSEIQPFGHLEPCVIKWEYEQRNPNFILLDNIEDLSETNVNTETISYSQKGMYHKEGGWPSTVDASEAVETNRYKKKIEKFPEFQESVNKQAKKLETCIQQNNQIDLFEEYFYGEQSEHFVENISTKTLMLLKDSNSDIKRTVSEITWHGDNQNQLATSYSIFRFQQMPDKMLLNSYVWDITNPNVPLMDLIPTSAVTNISFNQKSFDQIAGGCYNGQIQIWDTKASSAPVQISPIQISHNQPVSDITWLLSKTGTELVTTSTDGRVIWWDTRNFKSSTGSSGGITDEILLTEQFPVSAGSDEKVERVIGGTAIEYNVDAGPNKFLIGTELGSLMIANKKPKKNVEISQRLGQELGRHLGPIYSIHRSPPNTKYFLTVGDWSAKIWTDDLKIPIITTRYHASYLSDGCFSQQRYGVFFLVRKDGWLDVWDYYFRQNEIAYQHKVSETALSCIKLNSIQSQQQHSTNGKLAAIGDQDGTVTIIELCDSLYQPQPKESEIIKEMFEREFKKEKDLDMKRMKEAKQQVQREKVKVDVEKKKQDAIQKAEEEFFATVNVDEEEQDLEDEIGDQYGKKLAADKKAAQQTQQQEDGEQDGSQEDQKDDSQEKGQEGGEEQQKQQEQEQQQDGGAGGEEDKQGEAEQQQQQQDSTGGQQDGQQQQQDSVEQDGQQQQQQQQEQGDGNQQQDGEQQQQQDGDQQQQDQQQQ